VIRGYFSADQRRRPFVSASLQFPTHDNRELAVQFLVDTGADRTLLAPLDAARLGLDLDSLEPGVPSTGVGGRTETRTVPAILSMDGVSIDVTLTLLASKSQLREFPIPSLLGRDVLSRFALFIDEPSDRVLLFIPAEVHQLNLP
jgi:predicted aspartyl protease